MLYDKNGDFDFEVWLAGVDGIEERARTRREFGFLEDDIDDPEPTVDEAFALQSPIGGGVCEVDFDTGEPLAPDSMAMPQSPSRIIDDNEFDRACHALAERICREEVERLHAHPPSVKSRPAVLGRDVVRLYNGFSYFNYSRGVSMNTFLTVSYEALGVYDHREAMKLHGLVNDKTQNWLGVGLIPKMPNRRRVSTRAGLGSSEHFYGYVVEIGSKLRFHVHQLMWVPATTQFDPVTGRHLYKATWLKHALRRWLSKQLKRHVPDEAVDVKYHAPCNPEADLRWQWDRFRYMAKSLGENAAYPDGSGGLVKARALFKPDRFRPMRPLFCAQQSGGSHNIWVLAQKKADFVSSFDAYEDHSLYSDWALRAYAERVNAQRRGSKQEELLKTFDI